LSASSRFSQLGSGQLVLADRFGLTDTEDGINFATPQWALKWEQASPDISWTGNLFKRWSPQPYYRFDKIQALYRALITSKVA